MLSGATTWHLAASWLRRSLPAPAGTQLRAHRVVDADEQREDRRPVGDRIAIEALLDVADALAGNAGVDDHGRITLDPQHTDTVSSGAEVVSAAPRGARSGACQRESLAQTLFSRAAQPRRRVDAGASAALQHAWDAAT
jgi:hypothetical protein